MAVARMEDSRAGRGFIVLRPALVDKRTRTNSGEVSTSETAVALELTEENVKVRPHRGRLMILNLLMNG
jgi:hypothetical protein